MLSIIKLPLINSFKQLFVVFTIISIILPSISLAEVSKKTFKLETVNWQVEASDCESWYNFQTDNKFEVNGWQAASQPIRIYGYKSEQKTCSGSLKIINDVPSMYGLFSYNENKNKWEKLSSAYQNISYVIMSEAKTYVLAQASINNTGNVYGDFTVKNNTFTYQHEVFVGPTTMLPIVGGFALASTTATSTVTWTQAIKNRYQLAITDNSNKLILLPLKIDNGKDVAITPIAPQATPTNFYIVNLPKTDLGLATWYAYKKCDCAASRDYPKGAKLKVTNLYPGKNYGKSVVVKVNDYGPMEYTGNLIDLDKTAFKKIANTGSGVVPVRVEMVK